MGSVIEPYSVGYEFRHGTNGSQTEMTHSSARRDPASPGSAPGPLRRLIDWADRRQLPVYAQVRGLWLLVRTLRAQGEERLRRGRFDRRLHA